MNTSPEPASRGLSGWFAVESDRVIQGWARDKASPADRLRVRIAIDGRPIATARCDRFVPSLLEQGESDGFSGFACAIPPSFRDGRPHQVTAAICGANGQEIALKSKRAEFTLSAGGPDTRLVLERGDETSVEGVLTGPNVRQALDLWLGDERREIAPDWRWDEGAARPFRVAWEGGVLALAARGAVVAYPGTIEAGLPGVPVASLVRGTVWRAEDGRGRLRLHPAFALPEGAELRGEVTGRAAAMPVLMIVAHGEAAFSLPPTAMGDPLRLHLADAAGRLLGVPLPFTDPPLARHLFGNADLTHWEGERPEGFETSGATRGFHAFPPDLKAEQGLSGHLMLVEVPGAAGSPMVARTVPAIRRSGEATIGFRLFARASAPVSLAWQVERAGEGIAESRFAIGPRWQLLRATATVPADPRALRLALVRGEAGEPALVEIAGLAAGAPDAAGFGEDAPMPPPSAPGANLVHNAALTRWPDGLVVEGHGVNIPLADGWALTAADPVRARAAAVAVPGEPGRYAFSLSVPAGAPPHALEVALRSADVTGPGHLRFRARAGSNGSRFGLIDRISLVRRRAGGGDEVVVALIGRKLAIGATWDEIRCAFLCRDVAERRFEATDGAFEHRLRIEFHGQTEIEVEGLELRLDAPTAPAAQAFPLAFEDPAIRVQVAVLRGLDAWRSPVPLRPGTSATPTSTAAPRRWTWGTAPGTVEIGVPVHDAADETLRCLGALAGSTGVPHLVHVLDDGSGEDTYRRLAAFVADKPWMRLERQDGRGYTASANRLVGGSAADWVVLLNSDTVVTPGWLEGLLAVASRNDRVALVGPVSNAASYQSVPETHDGTGKWAVNPLPPGWEPDAMATLVAGVSDAEHPEVPLLNGFCTLIRRAAFEAVGGFDERSFPAGYGEENDLCLRLRKAGWRLRVADDVYVWHAKSASFGHARRADLSKAGDKAFRALHPDVDVGALGRDFLATPALARLRAAVRDAMPSPTMPVGKGG